MEEEDHQQQKNPDSKDFFAKASDALGGATQPLDTLPLPELITMLNESPDLGNRVAAAQELGRRSGSAVLYTLSNAAHDTNQPMVVRMAAHQGLGQYLVKLQVQILLDNTHNADWKVRATVIEGLVPLAVYGFNAALNALNEATHDPNDTVRAAAERALAQVAAKKATQEKASE